MSQWQFFDGATGLPLGRYFSGDADSLSANTPAGAIAVEVDNIDDARCLDLASGRVVPWRPPMPADPMQDWSWSDEQRRWVGTPSFAARQAERLAMIDQQLADAERRQARPAGDILTAMLSGQQPDAGDVTTLANLRAFVAAGREARRQLAAATTVAQLATTRWPDT